jgi:TPR repeat protein
MIKKLIGFFKNRAVRKQAVIWTKLAAEQGDAREQYNLGWMYDEGQGVAQNDVEAFKLFKLAADQGLAQAQYITNKLAAEREVV